MKAGAGRRGCADAAAAASRQITFEEPALRARREPTSGLSAARRHWDTLLCVTGILSWALGRSGACLGPARGGQQGWHGG